MRRWLDRAFYRFCRMMCRVVFSPCFCVRVYGREHVPRTGGVLLVSNHQSFLDPMLVGLGVERQLRFLARESLFRTWPFGWLIRTVGAVPLRREGVGVSGIRASLGILAAGEALLVFPEGTRTRDGQVGRLQRGLGLLAAKANVPVVPVAVHGAFEAWPRTQKLFRLRPIRVGFGPAVEPEQIAAMKPREVVTVVRQRILDCLDRVTPPETREELNQDRIG